MIEIGDDDGLVDLTDDVDALCGDLLDVIADHDLEPAAALCACLQIVFDHIGDEVGMASVRDLFNQYEAVWREEYAGRAATFHPPYQGVLQ